MKNYNHTLIKVFFFTCFFLLLSVGKVFADASCGDGAVCLGTSSYLKVNDCYYQNGYCYNYESTLEPNATINCSPTQELGSCTGNATGGAGCTGSLITGGGIKRCSNSGIVCSGSGDCNSDNYYCSVSGDTCLASQSGQVCTGAVIEYGFCSNAPGELCGSQAECDFSSSGRNISPYTIGTCDGLLAENNGICIKLSNSGTCVDTGGTCGAPQDKTLGCCAACTPNCSGGPGSSDGCGGTCPPVSNCTWGAWSACSSSCNGTQTRWNVCGYSETQDCNVGAAACSGCTSSISWGACNTTSCTRTGTDACSPPNSYTQNCSPSECTPCYNNITWGACNNSTCTQVGTDSCSPPGTYTQTCNVALCDACASTITWGACNVGTCTQAGTDACTPPNSYNQTCPGGCGPSCTTTIEEVVSYCEPSVTCGPCGRRVKTFWDSDYPTIECSNECVDDPAGCCAVPDKDWWQTSGGSVYAAQASGTAIQSSPPGFSPICAGSEPCVPYLVIPDLDKTPDSEGFAFSGGGSIETFGFTTYPRINIRAIGTKFSPGEENFEYFKNLANVDTSTSHNGDFDDLNNAQLPATVRNYYYVSGDMTINSLVTTRPWQVNSGQKYVIFVDGNLSFRDQGNVGDLVTVAEGGYLMFVVRGNIDVNADVGHSDQVTQTGNIAGVFIADGKIRILTDTNPDQDWRFVGEGTFVGWSGVELNRDFNFDAGAGGTGTDNLDEYSPTELFRYRPDLIINTPPELKSSRLLWQEVN